MAENSVFIKPKMAIKVDNRAVYSIKILNNNYYNMKKLTHLISILFFLIYATFSSHNIILLFSSEIVNKKSIDFIPLLQAKNEAFEENKINRNNLSEDSLNIARILWRLKTPFIKKKMDLILKDIAYEKKLIDPYPVDFYFLNPNKRERGELGNKRYIKNNTIYMPVDKIIDSLSNIITRSVILRINKIDYEMEKLNIGLLAGPTFDNSYLNLNIFPDLKDREKLKTLLLETILKSDKKRSFEWIWGKSIDNDAYYSTKLTAFNGAFTIYLEYRTFIGQNSFRDKNGWFYQLANYEQKSENIEKKEQFLLTTRNDDNQNNLVEEKKATTNEGVSNNFIKIKQKAKKRFKAPFIYDSSIDSLIFNVFQYDKVFGKDKYYLDYEKEISINAIMDSLSYRIIDNVNILKTDKNDIEFQCDSIVNNLNYNETIFILDSISSSDKFYKEKIKTILAQAYNQPMKRKTIEFMYGKTKSGYSYYALVLTIFNGQLTIFNNYRKNAKRDYYIDKKGWFNQLPVFLETKNR